MHAFVAIVISFWKRRSFRTSALLESFEFAFDFSFSLDLEPINLGFGDWQLSPQTLELFLEIGRLFRRFLMIRELDRSNCFYDFTSIRSYSDLAHTAEFLLVTAGRALTGPTVCCAVLTVFPYS